MAKRPTLSDVAKLAGVSTAVVSAVVNNRDGQNIRVNPETKERVLQAVSELGYVANPAARILARGQNRLIGIFTYEPIFPFQHHDFYYPFLLGIEEEAENQGYNLLLFTNVTDPSGKRSIYHDGASQLSLADGSILLGLNENKDELRRLQEADYSFVYVGRRDVPGTTIPHTAADYITGTRKLTEMLFDYGHKKLAYICLPRVIESNQDRLQGFCLAYELKGLPILQEQIIRIDPELITRDFIRGLITLGISGLVVENDLIARPLIKVLKSMNIRIPEEFSIALCGNPQNPSDETVDWTMFNIPRKEMGIYAVRLLVQKIENPSGMEPVMYNLPCTIVPGHTIASPYTFSKEV